ncbi:hypothetical protein [Sneathiella litorea]|uniref:Uncharacterized protein n=1 Tax=Sneathiella litorea TaxID=2606216 RepID=A0A6L8W6F1_9PROT|nr:hypothetical protein [Sneathiella litorea]MZR30638.1 hypothetical protein [Sneathiella litorea]
MSTDKYFLAKEKTLPVVSYFEEKAISLIGRKKYSVLKEKTSNGSSYIHEKTIILIDRIVQLIDYKILSALIFLAVIALGISHIWVQQSPQEITFTPEQVAYLTAPDTRLQSRFYSFFCVVVFGFFLFAALYTPNIFQKSENSGWQFSSIVPKWILPWLAIGFWIAYVLLYKKNGDGFLQAGLKGRDFLLALATAYMMKEAIQGRFRTRTIAIALFSVISLTYLLPLVLPYEIAETRLFSMDMHWSAVLGDGLYTEPLTGSDWAAFSNYGLLLNKLIASSRLIPLFESLGGTVTFLKLINLVFTGLIIAIIFQRLGMKNIKMVGVTALLILIVYSSRISGVAETFNAPNQLPIRILMIPVMVLLAYYLAGRRGAIGAIVFGLISPVLVFYNFETSYYCILAMGFAIFIESARKGILSVVTSGTAFAVSFLLSGCFLMLTLFDGSLSTIFAKLVEIAGIKIQSGTSGFAGLSAYFFLPFLWIMLHSFVLFSRYLLSIKDQDPLSPIEFQNIVIVGMIIAVGPYIMNRFSTQNMLVPFLLYTLLVLPKFTTGPRADRVVWAFILIVFITPFIFGNPLKRIWSKESVAIVSDKFLGNLDPCLDGITASDRLCNYTLEKADELKQLVQKNPGLEWISELSLNMTRLTGTQPAFDQKAHFFFGHNKERRDILLTSLRQLQAPVIAIDYNIRPRGNEGVHPENYAGIHSTAENFQRNLVRAAGYQIAGKTKYWVIARKRYR